MEEVRVPSGFQSSLEVRQVFSVQRIVDDFFTRGRLHRCGECMEFCFILIGGLVYFFIIPRVRKESMHRAVQISKFFYVIRA